MTNVVFDAVFVLYLPAVFLYCLDAMPAPEQTPLMEEGLQKVPQEAPPTTSMEPEATATNILASVKEQVRPNCPLSLVNLVVHLTAHVLLATVVSYKYECKIFATNTPKR